MLLNFLLADQKSFFPLSKHYNLLFVQLEDNILCALVYRPHFRTIKQKNLLENLDNLRNLNINLVILV